MKYEMIFGDEGVFDGAPDECFCVAKNVYDENVFYKAVDACLFWLDGGTWKPLQFMSCTPISMRRIIAEPKRWTVEDQKTGRLPEVGSLCCDESFTFKVINVTDKYVVIETMKSGDVYSLPHHSFMSSCKPLETQAEKYQREEGEWVNKAWSETAVFAGVTQDEHDRLRIHLRHIYRAQLYGELAVPKGGE